MNSKPISARTRVVWLTNFAAPYRRPVWRELARHVELQVLLLDSPTSQQGSARDTDWFAPHDGDDFELVPAPVRRTRLGSSEHIWGGRMIATAVASAAAVILGGWEEPVYWQALMVASTVGVRRVGFYESTLTTQRHRSGPVDRLRNAYFRSLDAVVTPGLAATEAVQRMGVPSDRISTGFNAVDVDRIHQAAQAARRGMTQSPGHRFVYVGQLIPRKNLEALLSAFQAISTPADHLTLVGDGPLKGVLTREVERLGLQDQVTFRGTIPNEDLPQLLAREQTLVLASTEEVWGLVVNEALAAGLQAVVSERCGVVPSTRDMEGVYVCGPEVESLASAMKTASCDWTTWIAEPAIMQETPARFADVFRKALHAPA